MKGYKRGPMSEEHKQKIAASHIGKKMSLAAVRKMSLAHIGKKRPPFTDETRRRMSEAQKGNHHGRGNKGKVISEEQKRKSVATRMTRGSYRKLTEEERRRKAMTASRGEHHFRWLGGLTSEKDRIRNSLELKLWREAVFKRDDYTCQECGARSGKGKTVVLNADHLKPFAFFPELRFAIDNGRTLCAPCHRKTPTYGGGAYRVAKELVAHIANNH